MGGYFTCENCGHTWVGYRWLGTPEQRNGKPAPECPNCHTNDKVYEGM